MIIKPHFPPFANFNSFTLADNFLALATAVPRAVGFTAADSPVRRRHGVIFRYLPRPAEPTASKHTP